MFLESIILLKLFQLRWAYTSLKIFKKFQKNRTHTHTHTHTYIYIYIYIYIHEYCFIQIFLNVLVYSVHQSFSSKHNFVCIGDWFQKQTVIVRYKMKKTEAFSTHTCIFTGYVVIIRKPSLQNLCGFICKGPHHTWNSGSQKTGEWNCMIKWNPHIPQVYEYRL